MITSSKIVELRDRMGLSRSGLATKLGVSTVTIGNWEGGFCNPCNLSLHRLRKLLVKNGINKVDYCEINPNDITPEQVRKVRMSLDKTVEEFSELMNVGISSIRSWEMGRCRPRGKNKDRLRLLANANNVVEPCDNIDDLADKIASRLFEKFKRSVKFN